VPYPFADTLAEGVVPILADIVATHTDRTHPVIGAVGNHGAAIQLLDCKT